jgi:hypothetical protein
VSRAILLATLLLACRATSPALVAVVEREGRCVLVTKNAGEWLDRAHLPTDARALRFSPDGRRVLFVRDRVVGSEGRIEAAELREDGTNAPLGPLPARRLEAFGLAAPDVGPARLLSDDGAHRDVIVTAWGEASVRSGCIVSTLGLSACGEAIRPLDLRGGHLAWRTNSSLFVDDSERPLTDVVDARLGPEGRLLVVRRDQSSGRVEDVLLVGGVEGPLVDWLRAPVIVKAVWLDVNRVVAIRADGDAMTNLLAHAPDEYGGEALAGEAVVVDEHGARPLDGLERNSVRTLHVPR